MRIGCGGTMPDSGEAQAALQFPNRETRSRDSIRRFFATLLLTEPYEANVKAISNYGHIRS
jgi:hypothetical protein